MTTSRITVTACALASLVLWPLSAVAQTTFVDLEVGYQSVDVSGNEDMYRTQVNQDDGFVLNTLSVVLIDPDDEVGLFDRFRVDASGFGGVSAGRLSLSSDLADLYRFRLTYRQLESYSALPGWANPFAGDGVVPGQHTWDRDRDLLDLELQLFPGRTLTPIVGYRYNRLDGPRTSNYHVGGDEFQISSDLEETEQELRAGLAFAAGSFRGALIQGWREFKSTERSRLSPGAGGGNNQRPVLGVDVGLDTLDRTIRSEADTPVTTLNVAGDLGPGVNVALSYIRADATVDTASDELLSGSLVSFRLARFFEGLDESIASRTENPSWRGDVRFVVDLGDHLALDLGYDARHRKLEGWSMVSSLYLGTMSFSGIDTGDLTTLVEARNGYTRDDDRVDARLRLHGVGPLQLWAGLSLNRSSLDLSQDVSQIVVPGGQEGAFDRDVTSYGVGASLVFDGLKVVVELISDDADAVVMRTDFRDRTRLRGRIDLAPVDWLEVLATAEFFGWNNAVSGIGYDGETRHYALDLGVQPITDLWLRLAWDDYTTDTTASFRRPEDFTVGRSLHTENGEMLEASLDWRNDRYGLTLGFSSFDNDGTFAFELDRLFGRFYYDFSERFGAALEYEDHDYSEQAFSLADFQAERLGVFFRFRL